MDDLLYENWVTQLRKGLLSFCILRSIKGGRLYGYDIVRRLREMDGLVISEGTIYPILSRFKREGLVRTQIEESNKGPARKYYELTERGSELLEGMAAYWATIVRGVDTLKKGNL